MNIKFMVPANFRQLKIDLPNLGKQLPEGYGTLLDSGPKYIDLKHGWKKEFPANAGGPVTVSVVAVGRYSSRLGVMKNVSLEIEGDLRQVTISTQLICS